MGQNRRQDKGRNPGQPYEDSQRPRSSSADATSVLVLPAFSRGAASGRSQHKQNLYIVPDLPDSASESSPGDPGLITPSATPAPTPADVTAVISYDAAGSPYTADARLSVRKEAAGVKEASSHRETRAKKQARLVSPAEARPSASRRMRSHSPAQTTEMDTSVIQAATTAARPSASAPAVPGVRRGAPEVFPATQAPPTQQPQTGKQTQTGKQPQAGKQTQAKVLTRATQQPQARQKVQQFIPPTQQAPVPGVAAAHLSDVPVQAAERLDVPAEDLIGMQERGKGRTDGHVGLPARIKGLFGRQGEGLSRRPRQRRSAEAEEAFNQRAFYKEVRARYRERSRAIERSRRIPRTRGQNIVLVGSAAVLLVLTVLVLYPPTQSLYSALRTRGYHAAQLAQLTTQNAQMAERVATLQTQEGIQDEARVRFGLVLPGETLGVVVGKTDTTAAATSLDGTATDSAVAGTEAASTATGSSASGTSSWSTRLLDKLFGVSNPDDGTSTEIDMDAVKKASPNAIVEPVVTEDGSAEAAADAAGDASAVDGADVVVNENADVVVADGTADTADATATEGVAADAAGEAAVATGAAAQ